MTRTERFVLSLVGATISVLLPVGPGEPDNWMTFMAIVFLVCGAVALFLCDRK